MPSHAQDLSAALQEYTALARAVRGDRPPALGRIWRHPWLGSLLLGSAALAFMFATALVIVACVSTVLFFPIFVGTASATGLMIVAALLLAVVDKGPEGETVP